MGYTTAFNGKITFDRPISSELRNYVNKFSDTRRMKRSNAQIKKEFPNWKQLCYNGKLGTEGEYFVGGLGFAGQGDDNSILDRNDPPRTQPGLWCQWIITDNSELVWNEMEKFYSYTEWLDYLIRNFLEPNDYIANGVINFQGEDPDDCGYIEVIDNKVYKVWSVS